MKKSIYSIPKLCKAQKGWYVHFRYCGIQKRYKYNLNYIQDLKEREREFNMLRKALHQKLKEGWNPLIPDIESENEMYLSEALDFALNKKKDFVAEKTYSGYKSSVKFYKKAISELRFDYLNIKETKRIHVKKIAEKAKKNRNWSNKACNKNLNYISALLSELIQWDIIEYNPTFNIKPLPESESNANIPATPEQHKIIKEHLEKNHPNFFNYIATLFHTGIRPFEILLIQNYMIDIDKQQIKLPAENTKTDSDRIVPINRHLLKIFNEMQINTFPKEFYVFGSYRQPGKGNRGKHIDFIPGPTKIKRDTATRRWKKIVKDGLGIDVNMYSEKHAGANAKILAGIDLDALRELYGHKSKLMTLRYAKVVKDVYRNQIIENSPDY